MPTIPFFVVITMTPFAPLAPYIAVDDASFKMSIDSISEGLRELLLKFSIGKPSITYNGELSCVTELFPLIEIEGAEPGVPSGEVT